MAVDLDGADLKAIREQLPNLTDEEKRDLAIKLLPIARKRSEVRSRKAPQTDDDLHEWIRRETGIDIPRVPVCIEEGHCAPFDFISDAYFERESALLIMAGREGGKTIGVAVLHYVNSETKDGCESCTFADVVPQAKKAYGYVKAFVYIRGADGRKSLKPQMEGEPKQSETLWKSGSKVEILVGTKSGVNSPHPQKVHADEIDLMEDEVWEESRNMSSSGTTADGTRIRAQDIATSTRKSAVGLMQQLIDESEAAVARGHKPPWKLYAFCIFEVSQEVPCCRKAPEDARRARLAELGRSVEELCSCDRVVRGEWSEGVPRTLESVCRGRFFRSRGWMDHEDVERKFMQNSQVVWEAQQECRRPMADGLYLPGFTRERLCIRAWQPKPEYGYIWTGTDWGGDAESVVLWIQGPLRLPVQIMGHMLSPVVVPVGAYVVFDMIYKAGIGATRLASEVVAKEIGWRQRFPDFRVHARFADMAGRQQRDDWREHSPPLRTVWYISRDFDPTVKCVQGLVGEAKWFVDITRCAVVADEAESWRQKRGREVEHFNHAMAANRYCLTNVEVIERRRKSAGQQADQLPVVAQRVEGEASAAVAMPVGSSSLDDSERWRMTMGQPATSGADSWRP